jgi:hypothetical protein
VPLRLHVCPETQLTESDSHFFLICYSDTEVVLSASEPFPLHLNNFPGTLFVNESLLHSFAASLRIQPPPPPHHNRMTSLYYYDSTEWCYFKTDSSDPLDFILSDAINLAVSKNWHRETFSVWRCFDFSLHPPAVLPWGKSPRYPLDRRLSGPRSRSGRGVEERKSYYCPCRE